MRRGFAWVAGLLVVVTGSARAQDSTRARTALRLEATSATATARAAADSFFAAVDQERWGDAARWIDMKRFSVWFKETVASTRAQLPEPPMTVEDLMAQDSTMPRVVAEWQLSKMRQNTDSEPFAYLAFQFARVRTQAELFALTPEEGAARWLEAQDPHAQMREAWRLSCKKPMPKEMLNYGRRAVVGALVVDSMAYVITRLARDSSYSTPMIFEPPAVLTMRRTGGGWRIEPQDALLRGNGGVGIASSDVSVDGPC